jgi:hypothetical protein
VAVLLVLVIALIAGCGDSDDTGTTATDTATTTGTSSTIESELQSKLDDATQSCKEAAGKLSNSTAQGAAEAACEQLNSSLSKDIASAADEAKGNLGQALDDLAADCRKSAADLPAGQDVAGSFCDAISASAGSVSGSG